jgi:hypothetical protein
VYKAAVFSAAVLCFLSFANAQNFAQQNAKEVTHYSGSDDFICPRNTADDLSDLPQVSNVVLAQPSQLMLSSQAVLPALQKCYTLNDIRGPPVIVSLI